NTRSLKFLDPVLEPAGVHLSETIDQCAAKDASDQDFCRLIQFTTPLFFRNANISERLQPPSCFEGLWDAHQYAASERPHPTSMLRKLSADRAVHVTCREKTSTLRRRAHLRSVRELYG